MALIACGTMIEQVGHPEIAPTILIEEDSWSISARLIKSNKKIFVKILLATGNRKAQEGAKGFRKLLSSGCSSGCIFENQFYRILER
jgi:hypothetical protein